VSAPACSVNRLRRASVWFAVSAVSLAAFCGCGSSGGNDAELEIPLRNGFRIVWLSGHNAGVEKGGYWYVGRIRKYATHGNVIFGNSAEVAWFVLDLDSGKISTTANSDEYDAWLLSLGVPAGTKLTDMDEALRRFARVRNPSE
jgi:hypothetical protein